MRTLAVVLAFALLGFGCQSTPRNCGAGVSYREPRVTLESVTEAPGSPGRGYPVAHFPMPIFPSEMIRAGIAGEVVIRATVGADGLVRATTVVKSSMSEFESPALAAVQRWHFFEFLGPNTKDHRGLILDCRIRFAFDES